MARKKDIRRRIKSVTNTKKITKTMELVATAKAKKAQDRVKDAQPYAASLAEMAATLKAATGSGATHPLFEAPEKPARRVALVVVTANRGLCGAFNTNLLRAARHELRSEAERGRAGDLYAHGKKGLGAFKWEGVPLAAAEPGREDKMTFADAKGIADLLIGRFLAGEIDAASIVHMHYQSAGVQKPRVLRLLPVPAPKGGKAATTEFLFEPAPAAILDKVLPITVATQILVAFMESYASEQVARRIAMKLATDNAQEMIGRLTRFYNRARQAEITQQIAEIVGGAAGV